MTMAKSLTNEGERYVNFHMKSLTLENNLKQHTSLKGFSTNHIWWKVKRNIINKSKLLTYHLNASLSCLPS